MPLNAAGQNLRSESAASLLLKMVLSVFRETDTPASFDEQPAVGTHFTCPVSGGEFEMEPHTRVSVYEGRHYAFCCGGCAKNFDADPAFYVNRLNEALRKQ